MNSFQIKHAAEKVLGILKIGGSLTYSEIKKSSHLSGNLLNAALGWLIAAGKIESEAERKEEHIFAFHNFSFG